MTVFLTFNYSGQPLELATMDTAPERLAPANPAAPGAGQITFAPIVLSAPEVAPDGTVTMTTEISGKNIAYIYVDWMLYDQAAQRLVGPLQQRHLSAARNKETGGVIRPRWGKRGVSVAISLTPTVSLLTNGAAFTFGFARPADYGKAASETLYSLNGLYAAANAAPVKAKMTFNGAGEMVKLTGLKPGFGRGIHVLAPQPGDQFTPFTHMLTPPAEESGAWTHETGQANPLTFGEGPIRRVEEKIWPGAYYVGLTVEDLDGQYHHHYAPLTIIA